MGNNLYFQQKMRFALVAIAAVAIVVASVAYFEHKNVSTGMPAEVVTAWTAWKQTNGRAYGTDSEEKYRMQVFNENYNFVQNFSDDLMKVGLNGFADLTNEEFKKQYVGYKGQQSAQKNVRTLSTADLPDSMDWREHNAVTEVKNQGQCGSCWAFSTTGSMEARYFLAKGTLPRLSEQQFVDCAGGSFGNQGCNGGLMDQAFEYAKTTGIETEEQYGYTGRDGKCSANKDGVKVVSYADVKKNSPSQLKAAVAEGPVSIALDAAGLAFQLYFGGIVRFACGTSLDHGVLIAGYGSSTGILGKTDYWLVKNSWGASWGEKGYLRIENNNKEDNAGVCGLNQSASYPTF